MTKVSKNDYIFKFALFTLPFENLFFAPSSGWATITPIIFFIYVLLNFKSALKSIYKFKKIFLFVLICLLLSFINYIFVDVELKNLLNAFISIFLGLIDLLAFDIYFSQKKNEVNGIIKILLVTYYISIVIGLIQFVAIKFNIEDLKNVFIMLGKRSKYITYNRVQFTYTEPSFVGMHLFGVLLPIYFYSKDKRLLKLICIFSMVAIMVNSGVRIIIDTAIVALICFMIYFIKNMNIKKILIALFASILIFIGVGYTYNNNYRIHSIVDNGIYADGSLASRYFRINASFKGYKNSLMNFLFGYGLGNSIIPIRSGYDEAMNEYKSMYLREMYELANLDYIDDSVSYCLYTRIISEFGVIMLMVAIGYLFSKSRKSEDRYLKNYFFIVIYLYIQFESYVFYTIWLYIELLSKEQQDIDNKKIEAKNQEVGEKWKIVI